MSSERSFSVLVLLSRPVTLIGMLMFSTLQIPSTRVDVSRLWFPPRSTAFKSKHQAHGRANVSRVATEFAFFRKIFASEHWRCVARFVKEVSVATLVRDVSIQDRMTMRLVPLCGLCTRWIDPRFQIGIDFSSSLQCRPRRVLPKPQLFAAFTSVSGASILGRTCRFYTSQTESANRSLTCQWLKLWKVCRGGEVHPTSTHLNESTNSL